MAVMYCMCVMCHGVCVCVWYLEHGAILKDMLFITHHAVLVQCRDALLRILHYLKEDKKEINVDYGNSD